VKQSRKNLGNCRNYCGQASRVRRAECSQRRMTQSPKQKEAQARRKAGSQARPQSQKPRRKRPRSEEAKPRSKEWTISGLLDWYYQ